MANESDCLKKIAEVTDGDIASVTKRLFARLKSERDRVVSSGREMAASSNSATSLTYRRNEQFDKLFEQLLKVPFADFEVHFDGQENPATTTCWLPPTPSTSATDEKCRMSRRRQHPKSSYEDVDVVAIVEGRDLLGDFLSRPSSIVAVPDKNWFAIRSKNINIVSGNGNFEASYFLETPRVEHLPTFCPRIITLNPKNGQFVCVDRGRIKTIEPTVSLMSTLRIGAVEAKEQVKHHRGSELPFGLAVSPATNHVFTAFGKRICRYSLNDWSCTGEWRVDLPQDSKQANVLCIHDGKLLFKDETSGNSDKIFSLPIDSNGNLSSSKEQKIIAEGFRYLTAVTFDSNGNILATDKTRGTIEVFSGDGEEHLARIRPSRSWNRHSFFNPVGVALLETGADNAEPFDFANGIYCSRVIAAPDYANDCVVLFGAPEEQF